MHSAWWLHLCVLDVHSFISKKIQWVLVLHFKILIILIIFKIIKSFYLKFYNKVLLSKQTAALYYLVNNNSKLHCFFLTNAVVFPIDVFEIITHLTLAVVASKCVGALTVERTLVFPSCTFINVWRRKWGKQRELIRHLDHQLSLTKRDLWIAMTSSWLQGFW